MKIPLSPLVLLLLVNLTMSSILLSTLLFTLNTYIETSNRQTISSQKAGYNIVNQIYAKLDTISNKSNILIKKQGNISDAQRDKIITGLESLPRSGFASHEDILQIQNSLKNLTKK